MGGAVPLSSPPPDDEGGQAIIAHVEHPLVEAQVQNAVYVHETVRARTEAAMGGGAIELPPLAHVESLQAASLPRTPSDDDSGEESAGSIYGCAVCAVPCSEGAVARRQRDLGVFGACMCGPCVGITIKENAKLDAAAYTFGSFAATRQRATRHASRVHASTRPRVPRSVSAPAPVPCARRTAVCLYFPPLPVYESTALRITTVALNNRQTGRLSSSTL